MTVRTAKGKAAATDLKGVLVGLDVHVCSILAISGFDACPENPKTLPFAPLFFCDQNNHILYKSIKKAQSLTISPFTHIGKERVFVKQVPRRKKNENKRCQTDPFPPNFHPWMSACFAVMMIRLWLNLQLLAA